MIKGTHAHPHRLKSPRSGLLAPAVLIPFIIVTLLWSSTWFVIADGLKGVPAMWSVTYRFIIASLGMAAFMAVTRQPFRLDRTGWMLAGVIGVTQFVLNYNNVYEAEKYLTSGLVAVLFALLIVPNTLLSRWFLKAELRPAFLVGAGIAVVGVGLLMAEEFAKAANGSALGARAVTLGILFTLAAVMAASISNVIQGTAAAKRQNMYALVGWAMAIGTLIDGSLAWVTSGPPVFPTSGRYWGGVTYLALAGSALTFPLYYNIIRKVGAGPAAWSSVLIPVIAMLISTLFEGYHWTPLAIGGSVLVVAGLVLALRGKG